MENNDVWTWAFFNQSYQTFNLPILDATEPNQVIVETRSINWEASSFIIRKKKTLDSLTCVFNRKVGILKDYDYTLICVLKDRESIIKKIDPLFSSFLDANEIYELSYEKKHDHLKIDFRGKSLYLKTIEKILNL